MTPDLPIAFLDFGEAYQQTPEQAIHALYALLLDAPACAARIEFLRALAHRANLDGPGRFAGWPEHHFEPDIQLITEVGLLRAFEQQRLDVARVDALSRHPEALQRLHEALAGEPLPRRPTEPSHAQVPASMPSHSFQANDRVRHDRFGSGTVLAATPPVIIVKFDHGIEACELASLARVDAPEQALAQQRWHPPSEVIARCQAEAIRSVNDAWGVLSRSRVALLPHQLWVCRQVIRSWPTRWLVADDVGLGKTIEAGLILLPLLSRGTVKRVLVLCPASLVEQWQWRMRDMFDIRLQPYVAASDTPRSGWWQDNHQVVASLQTLRMNSDQPDAATAKRRQRLLEADPWDLVIVDEAHHLNADEKTGPTHGYELIHDLQEAGRIVSLLFFSGTPHRGKEHGFLALLNLLRPDLFDMRRSLAEQIGRLSEVMIRNNKALVTDLQGKRLFQEPLAKFHTYSFSAEESAFYDMLTDFIASGKAYASQLTDRERRSVILVLIAMQKLASSSVAAIRRALRGRLERVKADRQRLQQPQQAGLNGWAAEYQEAENSGDLDAESRLEERIDEVAVLLRLMQDEEARLEELLQAADRVTTETKITKVMELIDGPFRDRPVLLFTEYKATQKAVLEALARRYGGNTVVFINGDERVDGWTADGNQAPRSWNLKREEAADAFTEGRARFLVSTEAGGEGIDLQARCHSLIHVDLPWNPMRLHQRVGRLNRYGQTQRVEVYSLRNPDTVEALIWEHLDTKLDRITTAFGQVMAEPEDLKQLVLGMASPRLFRELFADAPQQRESVTNWFDSRTARFGDRDALEVVRELVGNANRFDFQQASALIPRLDLPDLRPFFLRMLESNRRRWSENEQGLTFKTPDEWVNQPGTRSNYAGMMFDRQSRDKNAAARVLGVGHRLIDQALQQARNMTASVAVVAASALPGPLFIFRISDQVTTSSSAVRFVAVAVEGTSPGAILKDWEVLLRLNKLPARVRDAGTSASDGQHLEEALAQAQRLVVASLVSLDLPFRHPSVEPLGVLWPGKTDP